MGGRRFTSKGNLPPSGLFLSGSTLIILHLWLRKPLRQVMDVGILRCCSACSAYRARTQPIPLSIKQRSSEMRSGFVFPPGASSLMLLSVLSIGADYVDIVQANLRICVWDWGSTGSIWESRIRERVGFVEAMMDEKIYL